MALPSHVRTYLAQWFQLGKPVVSRDGQHHYLPALIFAGESYSAEFERIWHQISDPEADDFYLEGTAESIADLLSPAWDIEDCARCQMPVPTSEFNWMCYGCPCSDMDTWPNTNLPRPRSPVQTQAHLHNLCVRLRAQRSDSMAS